MRQLITFAIITLSVFTAIGLACAVRIALRPPAPVRRDPYLQPIGDVPGFSAEQLREIERQANERIARDPLRRSFATRDLNLNSAGLALRTEADGVGHPQHSPRAHAVRSFFKGLRHA